MVHCALHAWLRSVVMPSNTMMMMMMINLSFSSLLLRSRETREGEERERESDRKKVQTNEDIFIKSLVR